MEIVTDLPFEVRIEEGWIPLADGTRLWMKAWLPVTDRPVPTILEYLPYRAGDWTAPRDHERHPYYAGHGYASIRVDIRGHGNSDGVPGDEYDPQELADGVEVVHWIAEQPWCTGSVGMIGISWGGFNGLQIAALRPEPLKAVVTVCSTDDRYDNDVHYAGGSLLAIDMSAWAGTMLAFESRPPDPRVVGEAWREQWLHRLECMEPFLDRWLAHQTRDEYWKHGSVCEDYGAIDAAVLAVGGWYDPYRDTVLRLAENLAARGKNVRGLLGPWAHQYPDRDLRPGPHIDFLGETLRWWDHWLKGEDSGAMDTPLVRAWITDPVPPRSAYDEMPGRWVAETRWPSPHITTERVEFGPVHVVPTVARQRAAAADDAQQVVVVHSPQDTGQAAGRFFAYGNAGDLPTDQRLDDVRGASFDTVLDHDVEILGNARAHLRLRSSAARGQVFVRLCDVGPDGASTLVTRGNLNLSSREGRERVVPMPVGEWVDVEVPLTAIGYRIPAGHALRVSVSTAYWPWIWPQPEDATLEIDLDRSGIDLPVRPRPTGERAELDASVRFDGPVQPEGLAVEYPASGRAGVTRPERLVSIDPAARRTFIEVDPHYGGTRVYPDGLEYDEDAVERYWIGSDDPLSARTESVWEVELRRPELDWAASVSTVQQIRCDAENFHTTSRVTCRDGDVVIFEKTWERTIPRVAS